MAAATMRAGDADRDRTAAVLREALAAGRLTIEEFGSRLDQVFAAKTLGELDQTVADLPAADLAGTDFAGTGQPGPYPGSSPELPLLRPPAGPPVTAQGRLAPAWRAAWGSWLGLSLLLIVIWLLSGSAGGPWFLWIVLPLGVVMLGRWISGAPSRRNYRP